MASQPEGYRCILCQNDRQKCFYGNVPGIHSKSKSVAGPAKASRRSKKRSAPPPSPSPPPPVVPPPSALPPSTTSPSITVRRAPPPSTVTSRPTLPPAPIPAPVAEIPPRKKRSNLSSYRDPAEHVADFSSFSSSPAMSSLIFDSDVPGHSNSPVLPPSASSSSDFDLQLMKIQLRASQEDLRSVQEQLHRVEVTRQAEIEAYRRRVAELEFEKSQGFSRAKGKGRDT